MDMVTNEVNFIYQDWRNSCTINSNLSVCGSGLSEESLLESLKPCLNYEEKRKILLNARLTPEILDLKICTYISACNNATLKPFPEHIVEYNQTGLQKLLFVNCAIPPVVLLPKYLEKRREHVVDILHWIISHDEPRVVRVPVDEVMKKLKNFAVNVKKPDRIYKIMFKCRSTNQLEWKAVKETNETKLAFYSLKVSQVYSLLYAGLYELNNVANEYGVCCTNDMALCLRNSPEEHVWGKSVFGKRLKIAAVVEFLSEQTKVLSGENSETVIYVIPSSRLIQVRYLLLYTERKELTKKITKQKNQIWYFCALGFAAICALCYYKRTIPTLDSLKKILK